MFIQQDLNKEGIISVSEITNSIKLLLENKIGIVSIEGEISNFKPHYSGHRYFTLKDDKAQIACTMWKSRPLNFELIDGMKVIATGSISVYPPRGSYQLDIIDIIPSGIGDLYKAFEELKKKLFNLGYFDDINKKKLPIMPMNIGISTSPTGAAIRDMFSTIKRRFPAAKIYFRPTIVQGKEATQDIVNAIKELQQTPSEIIIIGRGGGSIEDLWAYNTEAVANAIFECSIPIISAVGHETDFSIADFVADIRAATPTAAAELTTPQNKIDLIASIRNNQMFLQKQIFNKIYDYDDLLNIMQTKNSKKRIIDKIYMNYQILDSCELAIQKNIKHNLSNYKNILKNFTTQIEVLYPLAPLKRGFAILKHNGKVINNDESLSKFKTFEIIRDQETVIAKLEKVVSDMLF